MQRPKDLVLFRAVVAVVTLRLTLALLLHLLVGAALSIRSVLVTHHPAHSRHESVPSCPNSLGWLERRRAAQTTRLRRRRAPGPRHGHRLCGVRRLARSASVATVDETDPPEARSARGIHGLVSPAVRHARRDTPLHTGVAWPHVGHDARGPQRARGQRLVRLCACLLCCAPLRSELGQRPTGAPTLLKRHDVSPPIRTALNTLLQVVTDQTARIQVCLRRRLSPHKRLL